MAFEILPKSIAASFAVPSGERGQVELEEIMKTTADIKFFKTLTEQRKSDRIHWECCRVMSLEVFRPGQDIITFGEIGDKFYIIIKGRVSILVPSKTKKYKSDQSESPIKRYGSSLLQTKHEPPRILPKNSSTFDFEFLKKIGEIQEMQELKQLVDGDSFGELALLSESPRSATVRCNENCYLAVITQKDYRRILRIDAEKNITDRVQYMKQLPFMKSLLDYQLKNLAYLLSESTFRKNQTVYSYSAPLNSIYFIKSGEFKVTIKEPLVLEEQNDSLLKLKMLKRQPKMVELQFCIKGKNEMFGHEELVEGKASRDRSCVCVSNFGQIYFVNINDLKNRPSCKHVIRMIKVKHESESERSLTRLNALRGVQKLKSSSRAKFENPKISQSIQHYLLQIGQRNCMQTSYLSHQKSTESISDPVNKNSTEIKIPRSGSTAFRFKPALNCKEFFNTNRGFGSSHSNSKSKVIAELFKEHSKKQKTASLGFL